VPEAGPPREPGSILTIAFTSGFTLLAGMLIGYAGGRYLDGLLGVSPWLSLAGIMLGVIAGFRVLLRDILREDRRAEKRSGRSGGSSPDGDLSAGEEEKRQQREGGA